MVNGNKKKFWRVFNNGNWTEWSAIWSEIIRVISKSNERTAPVRFGRILLQRFKHFWYKLVEISLIFHHIWSKFGWVYNVITELICIF